MMIPNMVTDRCHINTASNPGFRKSEAMSNTITVATSYYDAPTLIITQNIMIAVPVFIIHIFYSLHSIGRAALVQSG